MPPHDGLVHPQEYDVKDSNVELIGSDIDHHVKYNSAATEPAWNDGHVGQTAGLFIWRIVDFEVVAWPKEKYGQFYDGDSYIILHSYKIGEKEGEEKLGHDIFFWLGSKTSPDEAGTAAYKTVELDESLHGVATQHRETQLQPSDDFVALFPRLSILSGGAKSGFTHVEEEETKDKGVFQLLRIFKHPAAGRADSILVYEVEPVWQSLDENDVFVLEDHEKIWVWQGKNCSPMEKAKAAQVVSDITLTKKYDVEVLSQADSRSRLVVDLLGGDGLEQQTLQARRPIASNKRTGELDSEGRPRKLFRLSDASGDLSFDLVKEGKSVRKNDFDGKDVFIFDTGRTIWVWEGGEASRQERAMWLKVAQAYLRHALAGQVSEGAAPPPLAKVVEGNENPAFLRAIEV